MSTTPRTDDEFADWGERVPKFMPRLGEPSGDDYVRREFARQLETELNEAWEIAHNRQVNYDELFDEAFGIRKERDLLRAENEQLKQQHERMKTLLEALETELAVLQAEVERLKGMASWAHTCIHHNDVERAGAACPCCAITRAEKAEERLEWLERFLQHGGTSISTVSPYTLEDHPDDTDETQFNLPFQIGISVEMENRGCYKWIEFGNGAKGIGPAIDAAKIKYDEWRKQFQETD